MQQLLSDSMTDYPIMMNPYIVYSVEDAADAKNSGLVNKWQGGLFPSPLTI